MMADPNSTNVSNTHGKTNETDDYDVGKVLRIITYVSLLHIPLIIITNGAVLVIIYQIKRLHTPYNYIVFALAASDFMYIVAPVISVLDYYGERHTLIRGNVVGCLFVFVVRPTPGQLSLNMLLLLSMDRFMSVRFPLWYRNHVNNSFIIKSVMVMLLPETVFACAVASLMTFNAEGRCALSTMPSFYILYLKRKTIVIILAVIIFSALTFFIAVNHIKRKVDMSLNRRNARQLLPTQARKYLAEIQARRRAASDEIRQIKISIALVFLFAIFWLPFMYAGVRFSKDGSDFNLISFRIAAVWLGFNSAVNAFVYALSRHDFKVGFKFMLTNRPCKWKTLNRYISRLEYMEKHSLNKPKMTEPIKTKAPTKRGISTPTSFAYGTERIEMKETLSVVMRSDPSSPGTKKLTPEVSFIYKEKTRSSKHLLVINSSKTIK